MNLIRKIISIFLLLPLLIFLSVAYDYFIAHDFFGLVIALTMSALLAVLMHKLWPSRKKDNNNDFQSNVELIKEEPKLKTDELKYNEIMEEDFTGQIKQSDSVELPIRQTDNGIIEDEISEEVKKPETIPEPIDNREKILIHTYVTGLKYEGRTKILKDYIKEMIESGMIEPYGGRTTAEIKEELMYTDDVIWEVEEEIIPYITVIDEPDNEFDNQAMAVYLYDAKIGYIPKKDLKRIKDLRTNAELVDVLATVKGGRYKYVDDEEKLRTKSKDYYVNLVLIYKK